MKNRKKILIVDDSRENLSLLEFVLKEADYIPILANSGKMALKYLENNQSPSLIILDIKMPEMSGFELCSIIKNDNKISDIPVIFLTSLSNIKEKIEGFSLGAVDYISKSFERTELLMRIKTHITLRERELELKRANKELFIAKEKIEYLVENSINIFFYYTANHKITYISPRVKQVLGYTQEETIIKWADFISDNPINKIGHKKRMRAIITGKRQATYTLELIHKNGNKIYVEVREFPKIENGKTVAILGSFIDITKRKKSEDNLTTTMKHLKSAQEIANLGYSSRNLHTGEGYWSEGMYERIGFKPKAADRNATTLIGLIHPNDRNDVIKRINKVMQAEGNYEKKARYIKRDGEKGWMHVIGETKKNELGELIHRAIIQNITKQKETELSLVESEKKYKLIFENTPVSLWELNITKLCNYFEKIKRKGITDFNVFFNENPEELLICLKKIQLLNINNETLNLHGFKNKEELFNNRNKLLTSKSVVILKKTLIAIANKKHFFNSEAEFLTFDGKKKYINLKFRIPSYQSKKKISIVSVIDITYKKKRELKLKQTNNKIESILDTAPIGIGFIVKREFVDVNNMLCQITGYEKNELIGENIHFLHINDDEYDRVNSENLKNREKLGKLNFETIWKTKKGEKINVLISSKPVDSNNINAGLIFTVSNITEKIKKEQTIRKLSTGINQSSLSVIVTDTEGRIEFINPQFAKTTGYTFEEIEGQKPNILKSGHHSNKFYNKMWNTINLGKLWRGKIKNKTKNGAIFWESVIISPIVNRNNKVVNYMALKRDITTEKQIKERLEITEAQIKILTKIVKQPVFIINKNKIITQWNKGIERLSGYSKEEIISRKYTDISFFEKGNKVFTKTLLGLEVENFEFNFITKTGKKTTIILNTYPAFDDNKHIQEIVCIGQDITKINEYKKELEEEVEKRTAELKISLEKEKELGKLKTQFVSIASHEFRTPLAAISSTSNLMKKHWNKITEEKRNLKFDKITNQVDHMALMIEDVLTYGNVESKKVKIKPQKMLIDEFLKIIIEEVYSIKAYNKHKINLIGDTEGYKIFLDQKLGRNIFINLLSNAMKFSPNNKNIDFEVKKEDKICIFKIKDYGIGIPEKDLKNIFNTFTRASNVETIQGTGLGLAIVKESIEMINRKISVTSKEDEGTCFKIELPISF